MKVLTIFIDMIRANRLSTFNGNVKKDTPLDIAFKEMGGTTYTNCFTPGPDTPRGISTFLTGIDPYKNGCTTRLKWPQYFLDKKLPTVFDIFLEKGYKLDCFSSPRERDTGLFPEHISNMDIHNKDYDMNSYLSNIELQDDHHLFISIPDYHWAFDDYGSSTHGEKKAYQVTKSVYDIVFKNLNKDDFDHIFIFSDHGFKFSAERKLEDKKMMLNTDRTNCLLIHRVKKQQKLSVDDRLCSLADIMPTYKELLGYKDNLYSIFNDKNREFVVIEDHINFAPSINQNIELWAVVKKGSIYIRTLEESITIDKFRKIISKDIDSENDKILEENSSFGIYVDEYEKIFRYRDNILSKDKYMNGKKRKTKNKLYKYFFEILDIFRLKALND
jgi:arylsulfatase A-like enzyme